MSVLIKASAPGSSILLGEHAVLAGKPALVCALDKRISVSLETRDDQQIIINSELGHYQSTLDQLENQSEFRFVLAAVQQIKNSLKFGFNLDIQADFKATVGFGSSAAVTVATLGVLLRYSEQELKLELLFKLARNAILLAQNNRGSGADVAASVYGGIVHYQTKPLILSPIKTNYPYIHLIYSGNKTATPNVLAQVAKNFEDKPDELNHIYQAIGQCSEQGLNSLISQQGWPNLIELATAMTSQQKLMSKLGVNTEKLQHIIDHLNNDPNILAAKISGSGLGDCIIALSQTADTPQLTTVQEQQGIEYLPAIICPTGFTF
ncbi:mevalonate kinase family protein [Piscirickettsia litoralis]|uniref:GHMP kinase n=1 Tax=Piscirickettsia litoralis TaxID=1891921 RepID=A0ABX3A5D7_9GAMM|nr:GHMP kinase [Piscirickettsia litoralis]ODN43638.1 GHMP kinase [Piscirickettsia litoralis]